MKKCFITLRPGLAGSFTGLSIPSDEIQGPMSISQGQLLIRTYCIEARDYALPNVFSPRDLSLQS